MAGKHAYAVEVSWTGNTGSGTSDYRSYKRTCVVRAPGKRELAGSADPHFRGDADRWNPEELLVAALSQCHLLSFLHAAAAAGLVVVAYEDAATGAMVTSGNGGRMTEVVLHPVVTVASESMVDQVPALHDTAHADCFIANSVSFPVHHEPETRVSAG